MIIFFFFFQAEDGIRDADVTGVQTCALPILSRSDLDRAGPGEIVAIAGLGDVTVGETVTDPDDPRPLPVISIDEPSLSMRFGVNTSPFAGRAGTFLTSRHLKERLDREALGN